MSNETNLKESVEDVLNQVRPALQRDGGDVELIEITNEGIVKVRLKGACGGCPMAGLTLKMSIERILKEKIPQVKSVEAAD